MSKLFFLTVLPVFLLSADAYSLSPQFYGIKMKSEVFARGIQLQKGSAATDSFSRIEGADKRIFAYAYLGRYVGGKESVEIQVYNHSDKKIDTQTLFRELVLIGRDGKRYDRSESGSFWNRDALKPGESASFKFVFPGIRILKDEIRMIICSFGLGDVKIVLLPYQGEESAPKVKIEQVESPAKKGPEAGAVKSGTAASRESKPEMLKIKPNPKPAVPSIVPRKIPAVDSQQKPVKLAASAKKNAAGNDCCASPLSTLGSFANGVKGIFSGKEKPVRPQVAGKMAGDGEILHVDKEYGFVVLSTSSLQGLKKGTVLSVFRDGKKLGEVSVVKLRDDIAGAAISSQGTAREEFRVGDKVG